VGKIQSCLLRLVTLAADHGVGRLPTIMTKNIIDYGDR